MTQHRSRGLGEALATLAAARSAKYILLLGVLYAVGLYWGLPSEFSCAIDSVVPHHPLAFIAEHSDANAASKYPAAHQLLLLPFYGFVFLLLKISGSLQSISTSWPYGLQDPSGAFTSLIIVSRMVSLVMALIVVASIWKIRFQGFDRAGQWFAGILLAGSGVFTYYARVGNFDMPYVFWWVVSFVLLWKYLFEPGGGAKHLVMSAVCSAISIATKDQAAGLVLGSGLIVLLVRPEFNGRWFMGARRASLFAAVTLIAYAIVAILPQPYRWVEHVKFWLSPGARVSRYVAFDNTLFGHLSLLWATTQRLESVITGAGIVLAAIGTIRLVQNRQRRIVAVLILPALSYYGLILMNARFVTERFVLPIAFPAVILAGVAISWILQYSKRTSHRLHSVGALAVVVILAYQGVTGYVPISYVQLFDQKRILARSLPDYVPKGSPVLWHWRHFNRTVPSAPVYENYRLMLPKGQKPGHRSIEHVFHPYDPDFDYILSDAPLESEHGDIQVVRVFEWPAWLGNGVYVHGALQKYYLYRKSGPDSSRR